MSEHDDKQNLTLRCKQKDPNDPTMLSCQIIPETESLNKGSISEPLSTTPISEELNLDSVKKLSEVANDAEGHGDGTLTVRRFQMDGKEFLEVIEDNKTPEPKSGDKPPIKGTKLDISSMKPRLAQVKGCQDKHCVVSRLESLRQNKSRDTAGGKEE